jgi:hypothetical protein
MRPRSFAVLVTCVACQPSRQTSPTADGGAAPRSPSSAAPEEAATPYLAASASGESAAASSAFAPVPQVTVENIGIHIGGGPNDAATKAPIAQSVIPHFDELRACWAKVDDPAHGGTFGVDLLVPAGGGRATVSHPRTALGGDAFRICVMGVLEGIDFARPSGGRTTASYALRFAPH